MNGPPVGRRAFLTLAGGGVLAACSAQRSRSASVASSRQEPEQSPEPTAPPARPAYTHPTTDLFVDLKTRAGRFAQQLATYDVDQQLRPEVEFAALPTARRASAVAAAEPLRQQGVYSRADVTFVQLGGLVPVSKAATYASCMVVLEQTLTDDDGKVEKISRTLDVRLRRPARMWVLDDLASAGGVVLPNPATLSAPARRVLDHRAITLADSARWDIYAGSISESLLAVMAGLAEEFSYSVAVLRNGHPRDVIDGRAPAPVSNHYRGRAMDLYEINGTRVEQMERAQLQSFLQAVPDLGGKREVGVPPGNDLDGRGRQFFANLVHVDHVHVAVET